MPVTAPEQPLNLFATYGDTGLKGYGGYITEEYLTELSGARGLKTYRRMATNDATIHAILYGITALVRNVEWTVTAADESEEAQKAKEWLEGVMLEDMDTPMSDVISEAATMFTYGFAPCEVTYRRRMGPDAGSKFDDGRIGVARIELRAQTSLINWDIDTSSGELRGMNQLGTWRGVAYIPRKKLALFRVDSVKDNPESTSLLRGAYRAWFFKQKLEEVEAIGAERNKVGIPMIRIPSQYLDPSADAQQKAFAASMAELGRKIRRDQAEYVLSASNKDENGGYLIDVSLLTPTGQTFDIGAIIRRWDEAIARSVLMQFIFLGSTSAGSFALSSNQTDLFATALGAYVRRIADTLNRDVVDMLWRVNKFDPKVKPKLTPGDLEKPDLSQMAGFVATLAGAGATMFPDRQLENQLRKIAGLPQLPEDQTGQGADLPTQGLPGAAA